MTLNLTRFQRIKLEDFLVQFTSSIVNEDYSKKAVYFDIADDISLPDSEKAEIIRDGYIKIDLLNESDTTAFELSLDAHRKLKAALREWPRFNTEDRKWLRNRTVADFVIGGVLRQIEDFKEPA